MDIIVLDGYCLNHGDLDWTPFERLGNVVVYERTPYEKIVERMGSAPVMITNKCLIDRGVIDSLPDLKYIGVLATGYNNVDTEYCRKKGIAVTNVPSYSTESVVQAVFGLMPELYAGLARHAESVRNGDWIKAPDFCYYLGSLRELNGKTLGVVGVGNIGREVIRVARAMDMNILATAHRPRPDEEGIHYVPFEELLRESDFISLHCPLTEETRHMIDEEAIGLMKPTAFIINTARGALIDEPALIRALREGRIAGAGLDVQETEPPAEDSPLYTLDNVVLTPHMGWRGLETRRRLVAKVGEDIKAFCEGHPINVIV